jgi:hypothetical protein
MRSVFIANVVTSQPSFASSPSSSAARSNAKDIASTLAKPDRACSITAATAGGIA